VQELIEISLENHIDIIMIAESENLDMQYFLSGLRKNGKIFTQIELLPKKRGLTLFANESLEVLIYKEEKYFTAYKVHNNGKKYLLFVTHFTSPMYKGESARVQRANTLYRTIEKMESACNEVETQTGKRKYNSIVVGDFNLQPFSDGIIGIHGFNAIMDANKAKKGSRTFGESNIRFFYNPMWRLMGKHDGIFGTYYCETDQEDKSFYWYTFDQVLLRPELIDEFVWDEFEIIKKIGNKTLIKNNRIYKEKFSDHLPIKFKIG